MLCASTACQRYSFTGYNRNIPCQSNNFTSEICPEPRIEFFEVRWVIIFFDNVRKMFATQVEQVEYLVKLVSLVNGKIENRDLSRENVVKVLAICDEEVPVRARP